MKVCRACGVEKTSDCYSPSFKNSSGLYPLCKPCNAARSRQHQADPNIRSQMLAIAEQYPSWTQERIDLSLAVHGLTGRPGDRSRNGDLVIMIDDPVISRVPIAAKSIVSSNLQKGQVPGIVPVVRMVERAVEMWSGVYQLIGIEFDGVRQLLEFRNEDGDTRWARASGWIDGKDAFGDGHNKLSLRELHNGKSNWTYGVRFCDFDTDEFSVVKVGKGRKGQALKEHQGCEIHQFEMTTGWHARVAEAMIHVELMQYHSPLAKGSLPKGGESEVFSVNDMMIIHEVMDHICADVNSWSLTECESRHPEMSKLCSSTSARLHSRQKRIYPLDCTS